MITIQIADRLALLSIEADGRNALSVADMRCLTGYLGQTDEVDGYILYGIGRSFSSGLALQTGKNVPSVDEQFKDLGAALEELLDAIISCPRPVVAAVSGHAIGAGLLMMAAADHVLALDNPKAKFGLPEVRLDVHITPLMARVLRKRFEEKHILRMLTAEGFCSLDVLVGWDVLDAEPFDSEEALLAAARAYLLRLQSHTASFARCKTALVR